ncbi:hypothetical protein BX600DRAFT_45777 [Xylariales sp. PMI_506]|nr:hypothetical protein BX600DRAFT_45777 [Xylariales sp. PMI_506]
MLKRKRSSSELSFSSSSTGSAFNSPTRLGAEYIDMSMIAATPIPSPFSSRSLMATPSHLHSRTMKRFRDSRPSEQEIHERTLNLLFSAAQKPTSAPLLQQQPTPVLAQRPAQQQQQQQQQKPQSSLHSFWKLPASSAPPQPRSTAISFLSPAADSSLYGGPTDCQDCGRALRGACGGGDDGDYSMDVDVDDGMQDDYGGDAGCAGCGKHVCSHCSITNLGERRRCLGCAGRPVWARGLGWTPEFRLGVN